MAERVKRRVAAAKLAVAFVAAGAIAGAAWAQAGPPPPTAESSAVDAFNKVKLDSSNIENGSLLFRDFKAGEVPSGDAFFKFKKATTTFKKGINAFKYDIKGEVADIKGELGTIKGELVSGYLKLSDADSRYLKLSDAVVRGDGSVFNAIKEAGGQNPVPIVSVPSLINVDALPGEQQIKITNIGGGDLNFTECTGQQAGILKPGESLNCPAGEHSEVMQLIGGGSALVTLNFSSLPGVQAGARRYIIAILIGM
jgi:hypothetical protein